MVGALRRAPSFCFRIPKLEGGPGGGDHLDPPKVEILQIWGFGPTPGSKNRVLGSVLAIFRVSQQDLSSDMALRPGKWPKPTPKPDFLTQGWVQTPNLPKFRLLGGPGGLEKKNFFGVVCKTRGVSAKLGGVI